MTPLATMVPEIVAVPVELGVGVGTDVAVVALGAIGEDDGDVWLPQAFAVSAAAAISHRDCFAHNIVSTLQSNGVLA